jgi:hypothetical protein
MGAGLGPLDRNQKAFMMITFTGEITAGEADKFNDKLNELLQAFRLNTIQGGGFTHNGAGHVDDNDSDSVTMEHGS